MSQTKETVLDVYVGVQASTGDTAERVLLGYFDGQGDYKALSFPADRAKLYAVMMIQCANAIEGLEESHD